MGTGLAEVFRVLDALAAVPCPAWISGGWGVDALAGRQTRPHRDLDVGFDARLEAEVLLALEALGYVLETDWRPVRFEMVAPGGRRVDLHPVVIDQHGDGVQAGLDGAVFRYPVTSRVDGRLGDREVVCLSVAKQLELHRDYPARPVDVVDVRLLQSLAARHGERGVPDR